MGHLKCAARGVAGAHGPGKCDMANLPSKTLSIGANELIQDCYEVFGVRIPFNPHVIVTDFLRK